MIRIPFITDTPNNEMKPIADEMLNARPVTYSAIMPPPIAKGMPANASRLSRTELNSVYSSARISTSATGTTISRRCWATSISWNSPAQTRR